MVVKRADKVVEKEKTEWGKNEVKVPIPRGKLEAKLTNYLHTSVKFMYDNHLADLYHGKAD